MNRDGILHILGEHRDELRRFAVKSLGLFGSAARDEARPDSDIDILVEFAKPVGLFQFVRLQAFLERLLGCSVDLVTPGALRPELRDRILGEAIRAV